MKVRYSASASADVGEILSYLEVRNPRAASSVAAAIEATVTRIVQFPQSAQLTDAPGIRAVPAGRYPYLIFYATDGDEILIIRILHAARLRPWENE
jgi:plasmid stabilization system protein ParE